VYVLSGLSQTNFVTYIQPPALLSSTCTNTVTDPCWAITAGGVNLDYVLTEGANQYDLQFSNSPSFQGNVKNFVITPSQLFQQVPCPSPSALRCGPRYGGAPSPYFNTPVNVSAMFGTGVTVYARLGARDASNGPDTGANPYIFCDPVVVP
jgi:hypothetical protein